MSGLHEVVSAQRPHIAFFGLCNAGKSSVVNAVTGQQLALVSDVRGTTTDPVRKAMELLPLGPVVIIDTPGLGDGGALGDQRMRRARQTLDETDLAVLVVDAAPSADGRLPGGNGARGGAENAPPAPDPALLALLKERQTPYLIAYNKADLRTARPPVEENALYVSARTGENIGALKEMMARFARQSVPTRPIVSDLLLPGAWTVLVTPIDGAAPKGRMILPQQQAMRDLLDAHLPFLCCQPEELPAALAALREKPSLVVTDSQAFARVARDTPPEVRLTSFSILFARYKGNLRALAEGAAALSALRSGDAVLISEGCTHHRQCGDIGTVKLPGWIETYTGAKPCFSFTSGGEFPEDVSPYRLIVHCGGCMLTEQQMRARMARAKAAGVPVVNYGIAIAQMHGILARALEPFPDAAAGLRGRPPEAEPVSCRTGFSACSSTLPEP